MRARFTLFALALLVFVQIAVSSDASAARRRGRWEFLGQRSVTDRVDHDTIAVTAAEGTFRALKLRVKGRAVQFRDMKIHFASGGDQDVELRHVIPAGGESRVIDVDGRDRAIRSVELWYDTQSILGKRAEVELYGLN
jgi:hypothetical protein